MAIKQTNPSFLDNKNDFLINKLSKFGSKSPSVGYYQKTRHLREEPSMQDRFLATFDSQVYPTILTGILDFNPDYSRYLASEYDFRILTENDFNLILDE